MHIHSLCGDGSLDGMPGVATESWCGNMTSSSEASSLASKMLQWVAWTSKFFFFAEKTQVDTVIQDETRLSF